MAKVTTLAEIYWPLMRIDAETRKAMRDSPCCVVCGRNRPLNRHHIVFKSAGNLYEDGKKLDVPLITLCGFGNNLQDASGIPYCHGRAHHRMLHFRNDRGCLEYLETDEPTDYMTALGMCGWERLER